MRLSIFCESGGLKGFILSSPDYAGCVSLHCNILPAQEAPYGMVTPFTSSFIFVRYSIPRYTFRSTVWQLVTQRIFANIVSVLP